MHAWATDLFPINRSLTGEGVRQTLSFFKELIPELKIKSVPSGYQAFDWVVPKEWNVRAAFIKNEKGEKVIDFRDNNLHLVGYSVPVNGWFSLEELNEHLFSLPEQPEAIPYVTSYYSETWGFCLTHTQRLSLTEGQYEVVIDSSLSEGVLNYGELILPGKTDEEILLSTYVCHPSMGNNELSGPVVAVALAKWLSGLSNRKYTYRIVFVPETIGSIVYLSKHIGHLKEKVIAGFILTCIGDDRAYSFLPSRNGQTLSDKIAQHVLEHMTTEYFEYSWLDRGSDERQYCAPGVDLPISSIMRSKYGEYPEYHTSLDNLDLITPKGLKGGFQAVQKALECLEMNEKYQITVFGEPQLGKRGLYPTVSKKGSADAAKTMMDFISYCDGQHSLLEIGEILGRPMWEFQDIVAKMSAHNLLTIVND